MSYLSVGTVPVQSDVLNSALSPVVYGDIALSIKINTRIYKTLRFIFSNKGTQRERERETDRAHLPHGPIPPIWFICFFHCNFFKNSCIQMVIWIATKLKSFVHCASVNIS